MADAVTPNLGLVKPQVGVQTNWAQSWNDNADKIDGAVQYVSQAAANAETDAQSGITKANAAQMAANAAQNTANTGVANAKTADDKAVAAQNTANTAEADAQLGITKANAAAPPGKINYFAGTSAPVGWLKANGATISRTAYAALFAQIGTAYGAGDGATTFNLPDLRGEFIRGFDDGRGLDTNRAFGSIQTQNVPSHYHRTSIGFDNGAFYGWEDQNGLPVFGSEVQSQATRISVAGTVGGGARLGFTDATPQNVNGENRPRNIALLACIKY